MAASSNVTLVLKHYNLTTLYKVIAVTKTDMQGFIILPEHFADIYTVSKRLGYRKIRTTEIYAKIIDKKMKETTNLIPKLNLNID